MVPCNTALVNPMCAERFHRHYRHYSGQAALLHRHYSRFLNLPRFRSEHLLVGALGHDDLSLVQHVHLRGYRERERDRERERLTAVRAHERQLASQSSPVVVIVVVVVVVVVVTRYVVSAQIPSNIPGT